MEADSFDALRGGRDDLASARFNRLMELFDECDHWAVAEHAEKGGRSQ